MFSDDSKGSFLLTSDEEGILVVMGEDRRVPNLVHGKQTFVQNACP